MELTIEMVRDALWLTFSDAIVFSLLHRDVALLENPRYRRLFTQHYALAKEFDEMLGNRLSNLNRLDIATVLCNDFTYAIQMESTLAYYGAIVLYSYKKLQRSIVEEFKRFGN